MRQKLSLISVNKSNQQLQPKMDPLFLFETGRLIVRKFTMEDAEAFFQVNGNEEVMRYIRPVKSRDDSDAFLAENLRLYQDGSVVGRYAVFEKSSGSFCGSFSLLYLSGEADFHIGYALLPAVWGIGFATELVKAGIIHWFEKTNHASLYAITESANAPSQRVLLKTGFLPQSRLIENDKIVEHFYINRP